MHTLTIKWIIFAVTSMGNFVSMFDFSSVNIALYNISKDFALPVSTVQWVMLTYQIVLTSLLIFFGRRGDMVNRRTLYTGGFGVFGVGAFLSYFSVNFYMLLAARTVQGIGGAILISNSFSIVSGIFKGRQRGKALGFMGAVIHLAGMTAPAISGFIMDVLPWRMIFLPGAVLSFVGAILAMRVIPARHTVTKSAVDVTGTVMLMFGVASLLLMIAQAPTRGFLSATTGCAALVTVIVFGLFYRHENRVETPLVDFRLFSSPMFLYGNLALLVSYLAMYPNTILFPFYAQGVLGFSSAVAGRLILPFSLFYLLTAISTGTLPPQKRMLFGMSMLATGLFLFSGTGMTTPKVALVLMQIVMGVGNAFFQPSVNTALLNAAPKNSAGAASGILSLFRNTGIAMGSVISVVLFEAFKNAAIRQGVDEKQAMLQAYHFALYCGIGFAAVCLLFIAKVLWAQRKKNEKA